MCCAAQRYPVLATHSTAPQSISFELVKQEGYPGVLHVPAILFDYAQTSD
jgi:hypothetical protein